VSDVTAAVHKIQGAYIDAVFARSVPVFMRLYHPNVRVFDAWGVWQYEGAAAWELAVEGWFQSLGTERIRVAFEETQVFGSDEGACATAIVTYTGESAEGVALRSLQNRMTWGLRTSGHVLRIFHEHTSAPIGFDDMKAILGRTA
jgi:ketosteroid isomerase-like protein